MIHLLFFFQHEFLLETFEFVMKDTAWSRVIKKFLVLIKNRIWRNKNNLGYLYAVHELLSSNDYYTTSRAQNIESKKDILKC